ncbi:hypothetical protein BG005_002254 [Podila minutissima]|nr:hypothetical protein BG005_002254 [Podila minutissima]
MSEPVSTLMIPETFLKSLCPDKFNGRYRDSCTEDWFEIFEEYHDSAQIPETGYHRIKCAGLLFTDTAFQWYKRLGKITETVINNKKCTPYEVSDTSSINVLPMSTML